MSTGYTYMVTGRIVHHGQIVPVGTIIEEAASWKYRDTLVNRGLLTKVTLEAAKGSPRFQSGQPATASVGEPSATVDSEVTQEQYNDLSVEEIEELLDAELLTEDEVAEFEARRPGRSRNAVLALVEEEGEED